MRFDCILFGRSSSMLFLNPGLSLVALLCFCSSISMSLLRYWHAGVSIACM